ncbi:M23 family metallopeptidase [Serinibacter arcticus]|uniref:M23 family metallopeptidase n=1 Tax=Serinibacter arcticus TaxID=1655435 RepID=UPI0013052044|nr:M23 family metallopeptidase [Serinibacter arcticus]
MSSVEVAEPGTPSPTTRRARRLASAGADRSASPLASSATPVQAGIPGYGPHIASVVVADAAAESFQPVIVQTVFTPADPAGATTRPLTRRELRRRQGEAFGIAVSSAAPVERQTAGEVLAAAVLTARGGSLTRRELRAATRREAGLDADVEAPSSAAVSLQQDASEGPEPAEQPVDLEFDFASVALTLSSLTQSSTVSSAAVTAPVAVVSTPKPASLTEPAPRAVVEGAPPVPTSLAGGGGAGVGTRTPQAAASHGPRQWVPRLAVLSALGVATVVTPIHAIAQGSNEPEVVEAPLADSSALDTLVVADGAAALEVAGAAVVAEDPLADASAATVAAAPVDETATLLAADSLADVRGAAAASRSEGRTGLPQCGEPATDLPNGTLAAMESTEHLTLSMPVQEGVYRVSSGFGARWGAFHYATDFAAPLGTPIRAVVGGEVVHAGGGLAGRSPNLVAIRSEIDGETVEIWYNHMFDDGVFVSEGDVVQVGDVIGEVGNNGNSTGPHLHLEIHIGNVEDPNGSAVDPLAWLRANDATPVTTTGAVCA